MEKSPIMFMIQLPRSSTKKEMVILTAFAGQMIATNVFSNVTETDIDEYLFDYLPPIK
jgi:hypothetical protein